MALFCVFASLSSVWLHEGDLVRLSAFTFGLLWGHLSLAQALESFAVHVRRHEREKDKQGHSSVRKIVWLRGPLQRGLGIPGARTKGC